MDQSTRHKTPFPVRVTVVNTESELTQKATGHGRWKIEERCRERIREVVESLETVRGMYRKT